MAAASPTQLPLVSLVIPGRDCERTLANCLQAVCAIKAQPNSRLAEIIFVDDGSRDNSREIARSFDVTLIEGGGRGPGAARNLGWRAAQHTLIWFVDSDCVAEPDALDVLLPFMDDPKFGGASGSYGTMTDHSLLSRLIHEEIVERHRRMGRRVNFLATFNVLYRRATLEKVGGFDERFLKGQDAELSFRVQAAGYALGFDIRSRVRHYHPTRWRSYLRTQRQQGYWRLFLHTNHQGHSMGDSYSGFIDHVQPPLAMLSLASLPLLAVERWRWVSICVFALLMLTQLPMTMRLLMRLKQSSYMVYAVMGFVRAYWRGVGLTQGTLALIKQRLLGKGA